jgi:hypothetical protein
MLTATTTGNPAYRVRVPKIAISAKKFMDAGMPLDEDCCCINVSVEVAKYIRSLDNVVPFQCEIVDYPTVGWAELCKIIDFINSHRTGTPALAVMNIVAFESPAKGRDFMRDLVLLAKACALMDVPTMKPFIQTRLALFARCDVPGLERLCYGRQLTHEERVALRNRYEWSYC